MAARLAATKGGERRRAGLPDYAHCVRKRSRRGGHVTDRLVAKLLRRAGL